MVETFMRYSEVSAAWSAAIATTFAACVALWLGLGDRRRHDNDRKMMAESMRYMIGCELIGVYTSLKGVSKLLDALKQDYFGEDDGKSTIVAIRFVAKRLSIPIADASKPHFIHLPVKEAALISALVGDIPRIRNSFEEWAEHYHRFSDTGDEVLEAIGERVADIVLCIETLGWTE